MNFAYILFAVLSAFAIPLFGFSLGSNEESEPSEYLTGVNVHLQKSPRNNHWYLACSLTEEQKRSSSFHFALKSITVESCDNPYNCQSSGQGRTKLTTKCVVRDKEWCNFDNFNGLKEGTSSLRAHGKVTCSVQVDADTFETRDYYFRGTSYNYNLMSASPPLMESLAIDVKKSNIEKREVVCSALHFLYKYDSLTLTLIYTNGTKSKVENTQEWSNNAIRSWIRNFEARLTRDIRAITCSVSSLNRNELISTTYDVKEEDRPEQESVPPQTEITTSSKPTLASRPPTQATWSPNQPQTTSQSTHAKEEQGQQTTTKTTTTTIDTTFKSPDVANAASPVEPTDQALTIVMSAMGLAFLGVFLFAGHCVHRYFTITWICCRKKPPSQLESHELKSMKSAVVKFDIPSKYLISSKDLSVDYSQIVSQGQFSTLYQGNLKKSGKRSVVVQVNNVAGDAIEIASLINDVQMRMLAGETNENVAAILGAYFDCTAGKVYIALQSAPKRNMREFLTNKNMPMGQMKILNMPPHEMIDTFCTWLKGVSQGLEFLYSKKIVHGNLAAENILVCLQNTSSVSITGFSHSQQLTGNLSYSVKSRSWATGWETSGWRWMPMESLRYMEFSKESDVWSFGVLMWEIFSLGAIPYLKYGYSNMSMEFIQKIEFGVRLSQPQLAPRETYRKMEACWSRYGKDRPKASQLLGYFNEDQSNLINYVNLAK